LPGEAIEVRLRLRESHEERIERASSASEAKKFLAESHEERIERRSSRGRGLGAGASGSRESHEERIES